MRGGEGGVKYKFGGCFGGGGKAVTGERQEGERSFEIFIIFEDTRLAGLPLRV